WLRRWRRQWRWTWGLLACAFEAHDVTGRRGEGKAPGAASTCMAASSVLVHSPVGRRPLIGAGLALGLGLPFLIRHAVDRLTARVLAERDAALVGLFLHPVGQAVAAEAGEIHQIDVLHVSARAQVLDEAAKNRGFELGAGLVVEGHGVSPQSCE